MKSFECFKKVLFHIIFIVFSAMLMLHKFPIVSDLNIKILDSIKFAEDSQPFTMYLNFDKAIVGILIFFFFGFSLQKKINLKKIIQIVCLCLLLCSAVVLPVALFFDAIKWDPKLPQESLAFLLNNLLIVCVVEEAFFRRYIQGHLQQIFKFRMGHFAALTFASIIFGFAHFKGGPLMIAFSSVAGLFYGISYLKTERLEAAVLTHFGFNLIHFLFFSYPYLAI